MPAVKNGIWVDMGGGTGSNLEFFGDKLNHWKKVFVLDLCPSLVKTAQERVNSHAGWNDFVTVILGDACDEQNKELPASGTVDVVTFSYALTMIPDWKAALRNAFRLLKPVSAYSHTYFLHIYILLYLYYRMVISLYVISQSMINCSGSVCPLSGPGYSVMIMYI